MNVIICVTNWYFCSLRRNCVQYLTGILCHTHTNTHYIPCDQLLPIQAVTEPLKGKPVNEFSVTEAKRTINFT